MHGVLQTPDSMMAWGVMSIYAISASTLSSNRSKFVAPGIVHLRVGCLDPVAKAALQMARGEV